MHAPAIAWGELRTMTDPQKAEQAAFTLSQEELYVLLTYLKMPAPMELSDLEAQVAGSMPSDQKVALLRAVERCLLARQCLQPSEDRTLSVNAGIARVLQACALPERSWLVLHRRRGQAAATHCYHQRGELFVSLSTPLAGLHHLVAFADSGLIQQGMLDLLAAGDARAVACEPGSMPTTILGLLTNDSQPFDPRATAARLVDAGLTPATAQALAHSLEGLQSLTVLTRVAHVAGSKPTPEINVTVIADGSTLWLLAQESAERLSVGSVGAEDVSTIIRGVIGELKSPVPGN
jgi:hypothetical protein